MTPSLASKFDRLYSGTVANNQFSLLVKSVLVNGISIIHDQIGTRKRKLLPWSGGEHEAVAVRTPAAAAAGVDAHLVRGGMYEKVAMQGMWHQFSIVHVYETFTMSLQTRARCMFNSRQLQQLADIVV